MNFNQRRATGSRVKHFDDVRTKSDFDSAMSDNGFEYKVTRFKMDDTCNFSSKREFTCNGREFWTVYAGERMDWKAAWASVSSQNR